MSALQNRLDASPLAVDAVIMDRHLDLRVRFPINDQTVSDLHARAFGTAVGAVQPWEDRLQQHSLSWIGAFDVDTLVGFVHACWDGGSHAFVLDTAVDPDHQRRGIGRALVQALADQAAAAGCEWLHVDYESHLKPFYQHACSFRATDAGLLHLTQ